MTDGEPTNVVQMGRYAKSPSGFTAAQLETFLVECRNKAAERLISVTGSFMPQVDDALFDLADKAVGIGKQNLYFDAMREVRRKRPDIESSFLASFAQGYDAKVRGERASTADGPEGEASGLELSLVGNDELEEDLAVGNAAAKISAACQDELLALEQRMAVLLNAPELARDENPLSPKLICNAFKEATEQLDSETEIKLIIFKLFERAVAAGMRGVYEEINRYLAQKGVLTRIPKTPRQRPGPSRSAPRPTQEPLEGQPEAVAADAVASNSPPVTGGSGGYPPSLAAHAPTPADLLSMLQQLVGAEGTVVEAGSGMAAGAPGPALDAPSGYVSMAGTPPAPSGEMAGAGAAPGGAATGPGGGGNAGVLHKLTMLQRGQAQSVLTQDSPLDAASLSAGNVNVLRELRSTEFANSMSVVDVMTLDVVTMLFDFILDDGNVPDAMKALIGRLQIPVLKVAMMDSTVFSKRSHPVRQLLDTLARLAIGWNEDHGQDDPLYRVVESVVLRVAEQFEDDLGIFGELLSDLETFAEEQQAEAAPSEDESAAVVHDREQLAASRHRATAAVEVSLTDAEVPPAIEDFLRHTWRDMLAFTYLERGADGPEWQDAVQTMEDLIWSVATKTGAEEQQRLVGMLPGLLRRLREGISTSGGTKKEATDFLSELASLHAAAVHAEFGRGHVAPAAGVGPAPQPSGASRLPETSHEVAVVEAAFERANRAIFDVAETRSECAGMGTTLVAALFSDDAVTIAHVGDSRLYRLRDGQLEQLTVDHSLLERLIAQGFYTREEAQQSTNKNYVTRAMGIAADEKVDLRREAVVSGDIFLLCSDGLSDLLELEVMQAALSEPGVDLQALAAYLVRLANEAGGKDNVSVVLVKVLASFAGRHCGVDNLEESLEIVAVTDVGRKRSHNEDSVGFDPALGVALLADGMGGYNAGEVASALAVNMMLDGLRTGLGAAGATPAQTDGEGAHGGQSGIEEIILEGMIAEGLAGDADDGFKELATGLDVGTWVAFRQDDGTMRRARLTWISPTTGALLFTDRQGLKVAEATSQGLAVEFRRGSAGLLENVPLFDRAVGSLMGRLKATLPAT